MWNPELKEFLYRCEMKEESSTYCNISISTHQHPRSDCELRISPAVIWKTLIANRRHPYYFQRVQNLLPSDIPHRRVFYDWFLNQTSNDLQFPTKLCGQIKATFAYIY